jgi:hypothetical protein
VGFLQDRQQRAKLQVEAEKGSDLLRFLGVDYQPPTLGIDVISQDGMASNPFALAPGGRHLVAGAFGDDLAFKLGERQ